MVKRESVIAILALVVICIASIVGQYFGVELDASYVIGISVTAIAALVRGESGQRATDTQK